MVTWSAKKRLLYGAIVFILVFGIVGIPAFLLLYDAPTCNDGKKNQDEQGVDCGGSCSKLCADRFLAPKVVWSRADLVAPSIYNIASYVINPNIDVEARGVPFTIKVYDKTGVFIFNKNGVMDIPAHRNTLAFIPAIDLGARVPSRITFEFDDKPNWVKVDPSKLVPINVDDVVYEEDDVGGVLTATVRNTSLVGIGNVLFYAILYDENGNAIGFSKTELDGIKPDSSVLVNFTWPGKRIAPVVKKEIIPIIIGSRKSGSAF